MEQYLINDTTLTAIGDALREARDEGEVILSSTRIAHTDNVDDEGNKKYNYQAGMTKLDVISIPGATKLHLTLTYGMYAVNPRFNFVCVWEGAHPEYTAADNYETSITGQLVSNSLDGSAEIKYTLELDINGDSLTIGMFTDTFGGANSCYGYYAVIDSDAPTVIPGQYYLPSEMPQKILEIVPTLESINITDNGIYTPDGDIDGFNEIIVDVKGSLPEEAFNITGNCQYRFSTNGWNWFIDNYGDKVQTSDITRLSYAFSENTKLTRIPFDFNMYAPTTSTYAHSMNDMFNNCYVLEELPRILNATPDSLSGIFAFCGNLREIPESFYDTWNWNYSEVQTSAYNASKGSMFKNCYSLRQLPMGMLTRGNRKAISSACIYYYMCQSCYALDEIINLPIPYTADKTTWTSNSFNSSFSACTRLKNMTFETNEDGTPKVVNWKSQTIELYNTIGYLPNSSAINSYITSKNSGITEDKYVYDDATYQALKDDPDWFTTDIAYSRYNHDSAVATINSLPDASAYLASAGGTNTIKFRSGNGEKTDGGAVGNLTAEEIAVAAAKGWTVSFA